MADSEIDLQVDGKSIYSLRVVDLKQELKKRDIPFKGNATKAQLQSLLVEYLSQTTEANDDKSSEDNSGTTVQSDDTNDTIESNSENQNAVSLAEELNEQTEPTDLSQDNGITSSVSFGDRHSIKLTIKLGSDSPNKQMSPKKSPSKEMLKSPPIEELRKPIEATHVEPIEAIEERKVDADQTHAADIEVVQKVDVNVAQELGAGDTVDKRNVEPLEKTIESKIEMVAQSIGDVIEDISEKAIEAIDPIENKPSEVDTIESDSSKVISQEVTDKKELGNKLVESSIQQKDDVECKSQGKVEEEEEEVSALKNLTPTEDTKQVSKTNEEPEISMTQDTIQEKQDPIEVKQDPILEKQEPIEEKQDSIEEKQDLIQEKQDTDKLMIQEIVLTEEVSEDLSEQRVESPEKEIVEPTPNKSKDPIEEKAVAEKALQKQTSIETENKAESEVKSDKPRPPRRRRWGGSISSETQQSARKGISSDQLKELIPDLDSADNSSTSKVSKSESIVVTSSLSRNPTEANSEVPVKQDIRVVRKAVSVSEEEHASAKASVPVVKQKAKIVTESETEAKDPESKREVSPPRKAESNIIFIQNLVRPFTLLQLKEVLGKIGKLVEQRFWIDKIKSKCFATYETNEEAVATRLALHGTQWPSNNPKLLSVDFATSEELDSYLNPELKQEINNRRTEVQKYDIVIRSEEERTLSRDKENKTAIRPIREWDRDKLANKDDDKRTVQKKRPESPKSQDRDSKRRRTGEERVRPADSTSGEQPAPDIAKETESPAKLLDDLFRKTNATPSIYWLPLTEEQATVRMALREEEEKRKTEERLAREEQMRKRQEENRRPFEASPPFRNDRRRPEFSPNRRGPMMHRGTPIFRRSPPVRRSPPRRRSPMNRFSRSRSRSPFGRRKR